MTKEGVYRSVIRLWDRVPQGDFLRYRRGEEKSQDYEGHGRGMRRKNFVVQENQVG